MQETAVAQSVQQSAIVEEFRDGTYDQDFSAVLSQTLYSPGVNKAYPLPDGKILVAGWFQVAEGIIKLGLARLNADGTLDDSFDVVLRTTDTVTPKVTVNAVAFQTDGKLLIGGKFNSVNGVSINHLARLNSDGSLDTSFNTGTGFSNDVKAIAIQPDNKIVVAGNFGSFNGTSRSYLARLNSNGSLDTSLTPNISSFWADTMNSVMVLPDGKIFIQGRFSTVNGQTRRGLAKLNADGTLDAAFVEPGTYSLFNGMNAFTVRPDGKIYIGGFFEIRINNQLVCQNLCRLNPDGTLDTSFFVSFGSNNSIGAMYLQPDGRLLVTGGFTTIGGIQRNGTARVNDNGTIDNSFNPDFTVDYGNTILSQGSIFSFAPLPGGGYLLPGSFTRINGATVENIAKIDADGYADTSFAPSFSGLGGTNTATLQPDGKVLVSGNFNRANGEVRGRIARFNSDGTLDQSFNATISGSQPGTVGFDNVYEMVVQPDGKIIIGGAFAKVNGETHLFLARLNEDGSTDSSFNPILTYQGSGGGSVRTILLQANGKILIGGAFQTVNGVNKSWVARLNSDGTLDAAFSIPLDPAYAASVIAALEQSGGKILIAGDFRFTNNSVVHSVARLNSDGSLDSSFLLPANNNFTPYLAGSLAVQTDGKILVGGRGNAQNRPMIVRLNSDGTNDPSFSTGPIGFGFSTDEISSIIIQPNGKVLISGAFSHINNHPRRNIARLTEKGKVDFSFQSPQVNIEGGGFPTIYSMDQAAGGDLIISGAFNRIGNEYVTGLARLHNSFNSRPVLFDFDGDEKTDLSIFRPSGGEWWYSRSSDNIPYAVQFGTSTDKIVPADYTGDGKTDIAFWRESTGQWFILRSDNNSFYAFPFGSNGDIPAPGDFDSDGRADAAVFRPSNATWYILRSSDGEIIAQQFGASGDQPVVADYDGDDKADIGIFRPSVAEWWILRSTDGLFAAQFGQTGDKTAQGDFTGDGKTDIAFWRPSNGFWYVLRSEDNSFYAFPFGSNGDIPAPGDYDGDGKTDAAVFRPSNTVWYLQRSTAGFSAVQFGAIGDKPIPSAFIP